MFENSLNSIGKIVLFSSQVSEKLQMVSENGQWCPNIELCFEDIQGFKGEEEKEEGGKEKEEGEKGKKRGKKERRGGKRKKEEKRRPIEGVATAGCRFFFSFNKRIGFFATT